MRPNTAHAAPAFDATTFTARCLFPSPINRHVMESVAGGSETIIDSAHPTYRPSDTANTLKGPFLKLKNMHGSVPYVPN